MTNKTQKLRDDRLKKSKYYICPKCGNMDSRVVDIYKKDIDYIKSQREEDKLNKVNRVEVIDETGRAYVKWEDKLNVFESIQDGGRTLKIFINFNEK